METQPTTPATTLLEQVRAEREKADLVLAQLKTERERLEELEARKTLGGTLDAGQPPQQKPEIKADEYARNALRGKL